MREFIIRARRAPTAGTFRLDALPQSGHVEVICHCIMNGLWIAGKLREDVKLYVVMEGAPTPPLVATIDNTLACNFDERSIAQELKNALAGKPSSIIIEKKSFEGLVKQFAKEDKKMWYLDYEGASVSDMKKAHNISPNSVFILGDTRGMPEKSELFLTRYAKTLTLGPIPYFASQCITIIHYELDKA